MDAKEEAQKYKIGKYILETMRVVRGVGWEDGDGGDDINGVEKQEDEYGSDEVMFDSEDEDECDELFSGFWDSETVMKRRKTRRVGRKIRS